MGRPAKYPPEFRDAAVEMVRESGRPIAEVARELGVNEGTLGNWISRDRKARGEAKEPELNESDRAELARLRRENAQLRMERDLLTIDGLLGEGVHPVSRYRCVDDQKAAGFPVTAACKAAGVSTSGYYDWCTRRQCHRHRGR